MTQPISALRSSIPRKLRDPRQWANETELLVRRHPLETVAGAFVGGALIGGVLTGVLLRGRWSH